MRSRERGKEKGGWIRLLWMGERRRRRKGRSSFKSLGFVRSSFFLPPNAQHPFYTFFRLYSRSTQRIADSTSSRISLPQALHPSLSAVSTFCRPLPSSPSFPPLRSFFAMSVTVQTLADVLSSLRLRSLRQSNSSPSGWSVRNVGRLSSDRPLERTKDSRFPSVGPPPQMNEVIHLPHNLLGPFFFSPSSQLTPISTLS